MKNYLQAHEWQIVEEGFHRDYNKISESIFSLGNGRFGQRANFEEQFSGESLQGNYVAGVYYPDKTKVGWWKIGYPEYFAKVLNAPNWVGIDVSFEGEPLDLANCHVEEFRRVLDMQKGYLERSFTAKLESGKIVKVVAKRLCSIVDDEIGAIAYSITPVNFSGSITLKPYVDADVENEDANWEEKFWVEIDKQIDNDEGYVTAETKKTQYHVCTGMKFTITQNGEAVKFDGFPVKKEKYIASEVELDAKEGQTITLHKYAAVVSSLNYDKSNLLDACQKATNRATKAGFEKLLTDQAEAWAKKWEEADIRIEGDTAAQQGIRFNIFQLYQTYTGEDERLNIGPKGFTGEKYGGSTYWDTEAYCIPFYMSTADPKVVRNLLIYRYKHLQKAIENAEKLGFSDGAALYPMVTMTGEECHNEWEITFEEIHRNGAIAFAIYDYIRYTGDKDYLIDYGAEVLIGIARFWTQRVHFSTPKQQYVMHGVTGPNEYENNINNNWYTNTIAVWCMRYALEALDYVKEKDPEAYAKLVKKVNFNDYTEPQQWKEISDNMYYPVDEKSGIFLQQEGYMDKEQKTINDLDPAERPINQNWSWDRILRSCFIKQADVLQGIYFFEDWYDEETIRRNFDFYEPRTVHESSLSPCVHAVLAAKLQRWDKAYEIYLRTSRLDLDDYNNDTEDGCHITSMAGTWLAVIKGFGGMRVLNDKLYFQPHLPEQWESLSFRIRFRGRLLQIKVTKDGTTITNESGEPLELQVKEHVFTVEANKEVTV